MNIRLRLLLFYVHKITKATTYGDTPPAQVRVMNAAEMKRVAWFLDGSAIEMAQVENRMIPMRDGAEIGIRIYRPREQKGLPIIAFFHGGGFVLRNLDSHDKACRRFAKMCNAVVVSVDYRLAPEYKFPISTQDAYDASLWIAQHAEELGGDSNNLIVMGDSAGGNLATVTAIQARDLGNLNIAKQVLIYPATDARLGHPSMAALGKDYFLTRELIEWFVDHYKTSEADILNPLMSPLLTENLANLPPAFVLTCSLDPLKDEGEAYANRLTEAGNQVYFKEYKNLIHGCINMPRIMPRALRIWEDVRAFIGAVES